VLVKLGLVEQRYKAVLEVLEGAVSVTDVARRYGVGRQTVHTWLRRYAAAPPRGCPATLSVQHKLNRELRSAGASDKSSIGPRGMACRNELGHRARCALGRRSTDLAVQDPQYVFYLKNLLWEKFPLEGRIPRSVLPASEREAVRRALSFAGSRRHGGLPPCREPRAPGGRPSRRHHRGSSQAPRAAPC